MTSISNMKILIENIFNKNPIFFLALGMCPTLAVTTSVDNALGMAIATGGVLIFSSFIVSLFRKFIPENVRIPAFIVITATFVTIFSAFIEAFLPSLFLRLGIYVPLIVVNCIILGRLVSFAYKNPLIPTFFDALGTSIGFFGALVIISSLREIIGAGTITIFGNQLFNFSAHVGIMLLPPGALLTMGLLLALFKSWGWKE